MHFLFHCYSTPDSVLCRQPHYRRESSSDKQVASDKHNSPKIEVHPQRDRIVEILRQREAEIKAAARQARAKPTACPVAVPTGPKTKTTEVPTARVAVRPRAPVQPDPGIVRPPWPFLRPLVSEA
jgi:hypothetical protein